jgi:hypothetical protein
MRMDDGRGPTVKRNDDAGWSSDGVVLRIERRQNGDEIEFRMKCCQKINRRHRAHLDSMGRKSSTAWRRGNIGRRRGGTREGKERRRCQLG